jgi:hypothetical protein
MATYWSNGGRGVGLPGFTLGTGAPGQRSAQLPIKSPFYQQTNNGRAPTGINAFGTPSAVLGASQQTGRAPTWSQDQKMWDYYSRNPQVWDPYWSPMVHGAKATGPNWYQNQPTIYGGGGAGVGGAGSTIAGGAGGGNLGTGAGFSAGVGEYTSKRWRDPRSQAAYDFLESTVEGRTLPYGDVEKNNMRTMATQMNTAAASQQAAALRSVPGATLTDPSMIAGVQGLEGQRQRANMDAALQVETDTLGKNHAARIQAADLLGQYDTNYEWDASAVERILAAQQARATPTTGASTLWTIAPSSSARYGV